MLVNYDFRLRFTIGHLTQAHGVLILFFKIAPSPGNKSIAGLFYPYKNIVMKTPTKSKVDKGQKKASTNLKTEKPLAEKDEVKAAEEKQRKNTKG